MRRTRSLRNAVHIVTAARRALEALPAGEGEADDQPGAAQAHVCSTLTARCENVLLLWPILHRSRRRSLHLRAHNHQPPGTLCGAERRVMVGYPAASDMTDTAEVFAALDRLIAASDGFASAWGEPDAAMLERLEAFAGHRLPDDFRAFTLRYGNAKVGYVPIAGLGPVNGGSPAAQALTEERRAEWASFPPRCLALGEENTDLIVLRADGAVEVRTESSRDLSVFKTFPTFTAFLRDAIEATVRQGKEFGHLADTFDAWRAAG